MIKSSIERLAKDIGYDIGMSDDVSQSNLLNGFCEGFFDSMPNYRDRDMQACYVAGKLNKKAHDILKMLVGFCDHIKENE